MLNSSKTFVIAELSANHGNDINIAIETIKAAKRAGADAIKLQTYTADTMTIDCDKDDFKITQGTKWDGLFLHELYKEAALPWEWHKKLYEVAKKENLICFSSPFDKSAVDFLEELNTPIYKIASFEITDIPLIKYVASKGKPMIISTGTAALEDIELAVNTCRKEGNNDITLLKCTSSYPAPIEEANLVMIQDFKNKFNVKSGLSDHTLGIVTPVVAVAFGATVIEKHFILNKDVGGPDASFSLDEKEFTEMVTAIRNAEKAIGKVNYQLSENAKKSREFCRSIYISKDVLHGDVLTTDNIQTVRPGFGLHPKHFDSVLGKKFNSDLDKGTPLNFDFID